MEMQLIVFELAGESYGVEIFLVESIIKSQAITPVPHMPPFVKGVMNLRGKVVSVIDLQKRFGEKARSSNGDKTGKPDSEKHIMIVNGDGHSVGIIVDVVREVLRINTEQIEPLSLAFHTNTVEFFKGVAKTGNHLIILVDLPAILS